MDWGKAKTIMIVASFLLNIFLGYQLFSRYQGGALPKGLLVPSSFEELLKTRNITVATKIPQETLVLSYLSAKYTKLEATFTSTDTRKVTPDGNGISVVFTPPLPLNTPAGQINLLKNTENVVPFINEYTLENSLSTEACYRFTQMVNNRPVFNTSLEITLNNQQITGYHQTRVEVMNKGLDRRMIPALTALRTLVDKGFIRDGDQISAITPGYFEENSSGDLLVLLPVWRVVHNGKVDYVNGINGAILSANTLEK